MSQGLEQICTEPSGCDDPIPQLFAEKYRPQLHFSPPRNWLSDPNGLVWGGGQFHLFYQHNPGGNDWGDMHWGHAVSRDLVHWENRPLAIRADPWGEGFAFTGSVVVDHTNSSGLAADGTPPMVALYTGSSIEGVQDQRIAISVDGGDTWSQYDRNPVIQNPGLRDFRDPKVFWNGDRHEWVMLLAVGERIDFYTSKNLLNWQRVSEFLCPVADPGDVLECPDLFPLQSESGDAHWVLLVSATNQTTLKVQTTRYFVGTFDGQRFETTDATGRWIDFGPDNYATVTWNDVPAADGRRIGVGWMSNWRYARSAPTYPWRGHMTFPRELTLVEDSRGLHLGFSPVGEIERLRTESVCLEHAPADSDETRATFSKLSPELLDLDLQFDWDAEMPGEFGLMFSNTGGEAAKIIVDVAKDELIVDRTLVGVRLPPPDSATRFEAPLGLAGKQTRLRIMKDRASIEVFGNSGLVAISANLFFDQPFESVSIFSDGDVRVMGEVSILGSIWSKT